MNTIWLIVAIGFGIAELLTTSLTLIWFSIGALVAMVVSLFTENIAIQIVLFGIISITLLFVFTKYFVEQDKNYKYDTNLQGIEQKTGIVKTEIQPYKTGIVSLTGEDWSAISENNEIIEVGQLVKVIKIEGVKLVVEAIDNK